MMNYGSQEDMRIRGSSHSKSGRKQQAIRASSDNRNKSQAARIQNM